jgi:hypothetical protein
MNRDSALVMITGLRNIDVSSTRRAAAWKVECLPISEMNCFGMLSREAGHKRVPEPPHMITGRMKAAF